MRQKRSETLMKKVDVNTDLLISRLQNMIQLSASTAPRELQASEMLQIESNAAMITRLVEELLSVSRTLKESWLLNQMPQKDTTTNTTTTDAKQFGIIQDVMSTILQSRTFDEELSEGEDDVEVVEEDNENATMEPERGLVKKINEEIEAKENQNLETETKDESNEQTQTENKDGESKKDSEETNVNVNDFNYGDSNGNNTIDSISNGLSDYNLDTYGNDNLDGLDFGTFGDDNDQQDIIMLE